MVHVTSLSLPVLPPFHFASAACAYGWIALAPTTWLNDYQAVQRVERLPTGKVVLLTIAGADTSTQPILTIRVRHPETLTPHERRDIRIAVRRMFRLDEDFSEFYTLCHAHGGPWMRLTSGAGRLLRSPTVFEDVIKTICTTNTQWSGTIRMVTTMVASLGEPYTADPALRAFPTPEAIARAHPQLFRDTLRLGYRGTYVHRLAQQVAAGDLDLEAWRDPALPSTVLKRQLLAIKGVGPYAAHTLLMLLGRYEALAIDSEMRAFMRQHYFHGRNPTNKEMHAVYAEWGKWQYLAYWFERAPAV